MRISLLQQGLPLDVDMHPNLHRNLLFLSKPGSVHPVLCAHPTPTPNLVSLKPPKVATTVLSGCSRGHHWNCKLLRELPISAKQIKLQGSENSLQIQLQQKRNFNLPSLVTFHFPSSKINT